MLTEHVQVKAAAITARHNQTRVASGAGGVVDMDSLAFLQRLQMLMAAAPASPHVPGNGRNGGGDGA